jgi:hypothetical protein
LLDGSISERPATGLVRLRRNGYSYFINPGSVDGSRKPTPRFAEFLIFDSASRTVEFMAVPYDYDAVERSATDRGYRMTPTDVRVYRLRRLVRRVIPGLVKRSIRLLARARPSQ